MDDSYKQFLSYKNDKPVIYTELSKALYGTLQAALLFWEDLSGYLESLGYEVNPYDFCMMNKVVNDKQCTIAWHVDDLKISHVNTKVKEGVVQALKERHGKEVPLSVTRGKVHEYLGMTIDYSAPGTIEFSMPKYVKELLDGTPDDLLRG